MRKLTIAVLAVVLTLGSMAVAPRAEAACGLFGRIGRVLGVQRRQERRSVRRAARGW